jgi:hypothetical protein
MDLGDMALQIVILGIIVSIGATVLINVRDTNEVDTTAYNVTDDAVTGLSEYGNWFSIIIIVSIAAVILALIFSAFGGRGRGATY